SSRMKPMICSAVGLGIRLPDGLVYQSVCMEQPPAKALLLAEQKVDNPAAANMVIQLPAVVQHVLVVAARLLEGIPEDWHAVEGTLVVDGSGQGKDDRSKPRRVNGTGPEGVAEDVTHHDRIDERQVAEQAVPFRFDECVIHVSAEKYQSAPGAPRPP